MALFKKIQPQVWAFDAEWAPDPVSGRLLYGLPEETSDEDVMLEMWKRGGATDEDPTPYLKTIQCRLLSISVVARTVRRDGGVSLKILTLPRDIGDPEQCAEAHILETFLHALGERKPQLVGYNSIAADLRIMVQRSITNGVQAADFCRRPNKPWEGADYFARGSEWNIDLQEITAIGYGRGTPSLNEVATLSGVPGKMDVDGQQVPRLWLDGKLDKIVAYNEFDALTTYLVWLRIAYFGGFFTPKQYDNEQDRVRRLLEEGMEEKPHFKDYLEAWQRLKKPVS